PMRRTRPACGAKGDVTLAAPAAAMRRGASWTEPQGGLFVWVPLRGGLAAEGLLAAAVAEGVAYVAGAPFFVDGGGENTMRLTFAREDAPVIEEGVKRLARAVRTRVS